VSLQSWGSGAGTRTVLEEILRIPGRAGRAPVASCRVTRFVRAFAAGVAAVVILLALAGPAAAQVEDYADYRAQQNCNPRAKLGTKALARWLVRRGGGFGPISRTCGGGGVSEHKEGRAFDWTLDASKARDRRVAQEFLEAAFATDPRGNEHALARKQGVMYIIWKDHMYSAWDHFEREDYLSSSCRSREKCSRTLRHRDHMHISLSRPGGRGETSWYASRVSSD
jgi:hypothetical protein